MDAKSIESTQVRYFIWQSALRAVAKSPVKGVGTGAGEDALIHQYAKDGLDGALKEKLNAHNEYLEYAVSLGVPGFIGLLLVLIGPFILGIKERRWVYSLFIMIIAVNFLTESVLERLEGTMFFGLFNGLFLFNLFE